MSNRPGKSNLAVAGGGCIGKCISALTAEELDRITDNVQWALSSAQGRKIFWKYLSDARRRTDLACLDFYQQCCQFVDNERLLNNRGDESVATASVDPLIADVKQALSIAEDFDDVSEIVEPALLDRYTDALDSRSRDALLSVLEETKSRLAKCLIKAHKDFAAYAKQPCPSSSSSCLTCN